MRAATDADAPRVIELVNAAFAIEDFLEGTRTDPERLTATMAKGTVLVAEVEGGRLVGTVYYEARGERGYMGMLAVEPARQGEGLASLLVREAEDRLRAAGCRGGGYHSAEPAARAVADLRAVRVCSDRGRAVCARACLPRADGVPLHPDGEGALEAIDGQAPKSNNDRSSTWEIMRQFRKPDSPGELMCKDKTVALVEWSWIGHHPMYFTLHARALLELGCTVAGFCPRPEEVRSALCDLNSEVLSRLTLQTLEWRSAPLQYPWLLRHRIAALLWNRVSTLLSVRALTKLIHQWEANHGKPIDLVFFPSIYNSHFPIYREAEWSFPFSWSALYIYSGVFRRKLANPSEAVIPWRENRIFRSPGLQCMAFLDEDLKPLVEDLYGRRVVSFPDLTDAAIDKPSPIASRLKSFASGRPIIANVGFLKRSKGVLILAELALDPANSDLCFAFIGEVPWENYSAQQRELIRGLADKRPNVFTHFERIGDEGAFNSCIDACDVLFAAYINFADSSGILTKAAAFRKPVVVSDGFLMAQRVRQFQMGEVIPEGDADSAGRSIRKILSQSKDGGTRQPNWAGYSAQHSFESLKNAFLEILSGR